MKYYSTQRPITPGSIPRAQEANEIVNFYDPMYCEAIGREAWGYVDYPEPISEREARNYELTPEGTKKYWCVVTSVNDRGTVAAHIANTLEAARRPENRMQTTPRRDIYYDWFDSLAEARERVEQANNA